jgi:hypothetical protein
MPKITRKAQRLLSYSAVLDMSEKRLAFRCEEGTRIAGALFPLLSARVERSAARIRPETRVVLFLRSQRELRDCPADALLFRILNAFHRGVPRFRCGLLQPRRKLRREVAVSLLEPRLPWILIAAVLRLRALSCASLRMTIRRSERQNVAVTQFRVCFTISSFDARFSPFPVLSILRVDVARYSSSLTCT